ncbi:GH39 family glycosyl hydrolase [Chryseobacterium luquanense]|uniref:Glycosyl hydrolases family 39 N-terminal catalytic domain-containing protein n=1 Tax=Chryseobacterium luquanense TaxID=2983766 RepID=A0ABT3Y025_9FLAO|nr:hypothetical protein [Chryseobacterium luquanense]MCX8531487.1 hypothetical protein [Chryseobacterium luquanense]
MILRLSNKKLFVFIIFFLMFFSVKSQIIKDSLKVEVDFNKKLGNVKSMSGFLHYDNIRLLEKNIKELRPKYWRTGIRWSEKSPDDIAYLQSFGITPILVISDLYGYPGIKNNKNWPHPLRTDNLKNIITEVYNKFKNTVIYDIWNEPFHQAGFGDFDPDEYYQIFKKAHDIIRALPGGDKALITGPSFDKYDEKEMEDFLRFCNDNKIRVDILSWHELRDGEYSQSFTDDVQKLKHNIIPKYPNVKIKSIILNEIINQYAQFSPSKVLSVLNMLEYNNIDGACKACWVESDGVFNCNNSINGLLTNKQEKRSVWWAYYLYNKSTNNRVGSISNSSSISSFAYYDKNGEYLIINNNSGQKIQNVKIVLKNLIKIYKNKKRLRFDVFVLPDTGEKPLENLVFEKNGNIIVNEKKSIIELNNLNPQTVYYISITNGIKTQVEK